MKEENAKLSNDRAIVLRLGINLGDLMVEDGDPYGDGVNIAARLEAMADPGGVTAVIRESAPAIFDGSRQI